MIQAVRASTSAITYFGPGPFRAFLSAVAGEVQHLYYKVFQVEKKLDALSATGEALDNFASIRGLQRGAGSAASVLLTVTADARFTGAGTLTTVNGTTITGAGTQFTTQVSAGDVLIVGSEEATVVGAPAGDASLTVTPALTVQSNATYRIKKASITLAWVEGDELLFSTSGSVIFAAKENLTLQATYAGSNVLRGVVRAQSTGTGDSQNVSAFAVRTIQNPSKIPFVGATASVNNLAPAQGGTDTETDSVFRSRIVNLYAGLNQGTVQFYESQVRRINPSVIRVFLARGPQLNEVLVYCLTSDGTSLSTNEKNSLQTELLDYVPVQTFVTIRDMVLQPIDVSFTTTLQAGATIESVTDVLVDVYRDHLNWSTWPFGQSVQPDDLLRIASAIPGVDSLTVSSFTPSSDVAMGPATLPRIGSITVQDAKSGATTTITGISSQYPRLT
jgi:uncharacterized phage protein gp47/JayE